MQTKSEKCKTCRHVNFPEHTFPCCDCDGINKPVTCADCRRYEWGHYPRKGCKLGFRTCDKFEWW